LQYLGSAATPSSPEETTTVTPMAASFIASVLKALKTSSVLP
jgi:hypothetical protein